MVIANTYSAFMVFFTTHSTIHGVTIKFANLILDGVFITNLYQMDKESTKCTISKY
jgi:hypothetical protein